MKKSLFEGEEILKSWNGCTLTNKRVWRYIEKGGQSEYRGFPLAQFQGATIGKVSYAWLMYIGFAIWAFGAVASFAKEGGKLEVLFGPFVIGGMFLLAWHFTKRAQVFFCSGEVKINVHLHANEQDFAAAVSFVSDVEMAATSSRSKAVSAA